MKGKLIDLSQVSDQVFAEGNLGKGAAIVPSEWKLVSPVDGVVSVAFPTGHAIAITSDDGAEILMHIGFDITTPVVITNSDSYFEVNQIKEEFVKQGDEILSLKKGTAMTVFSS